ncbi:MAG TPA: hypothetical protein VKP30_03925, partial [Polyangiaceae bacterium]|nr:hypothetical protein [Polyangiaceae bacterium]
NIMFCPGASRIDIAEWSIPQCREFAKQGLGNARVSRALRVPHDGVICHCRSEQRAAFVGACS